MISVVPSHYIAVQTKQVLYYECTIIGNNLHSHTYLVSNVYA